MPHVQRTARGMTIAHSKCACASKLAWKLQAHKRKHASYKTAAFGFIKNIYTHQAFIVCTMKTYKDQARALETESAGALGCVCVQNGAEVLLGQLGPHFIHKKHFRVGHLKRTNKKFKKIRDISTGADRHNTLFICSWPAKVRSWKAGILQMFWSECPGLCVTIRQ